MERLLSLFFWRANRLAKLVTDKGLTLSVKSNFFDLKKKGAGQALVEVYQSNWGMEFVGGTMWDPLYKEILEILPKKTGGMIRCARRAQQFIPPEQFVSGYGVWRE